MHVEGVFWEEEWLSLKTDGKIGDESKCSGGIIVEGIKRERKFQN